MSIDYSRRRFLRTFGKSFAYLGLSASGVDMLIRSLLQKAYAQEFSPSSVGSGSCYVHWTMPSAPPRWLFDLLLTPYGTTASNFKAGAFGTSYVINNNEVEIAYKLNKTKIGGKNIYLPPVWSMPIQGGDAFTSVLPHALFVRGVDMEIDNHNLSNQRQVSPVIGGVSISGSVADSSAQAIPAITDSGSGASLGFKTQKGLSRYDISYSGLTNAKNPLRTLLSPFTPFFNSRSQHSGDQVLLQEQALREFEHFAEINEIDPRALTKMYDNAMELIDRNILGIADRWESTYGKYEQIIHTALRPSKGSLPGIFDKAIPGSDSHPYFKYLRDKGGVYLNVDDVRDMITKDTTISRLAENFTLSELALNTLTSNLTLSARPMSKVSFAGKISNTTHDQHDVGIGVSTLQNTLFFRAFLAGLTEQVKVLKQQNIFDKTVIHIASEFNRSPLADGSGSDHGVQGSNATLISGMIENFGIIGNIKINSGKSSYPGTWGVAAPYKLDGFNRPIQVNDIALTVTSMLGVDSVVTNGIPLLKLNTATGKWQVRKDEAKNV